MRRAARILFELIDRWSERVFTPELNPLAQLGALAWYCYWIVIVSGIYLYIFFDTGITRAYASVEYLTNVQWYAGGVMRSLHRYASDAMIPVVTLHMAREFVMDRYRGARWFAWGTGVVLLWFLYASGITGYWVVWDRLAQYVAVATTEWFDALGIFGKPIARNFLNEAAVSGRFFTLMSFIHIAAPLLLLFGMWIHIQRHVQPRVNPPLKLAAGILATLTALSLIHPATSQGPANLDVVPASIGLDWFYLIILPLADRYSGELAWAVALGFSLLLFLLPWLPALKQAPVAQVDLQNCNGCGRCANDCPYNAITLQNRTDGKPYKLQSSVNPSLCLSCGICVGACHAASPFRREPQFIAGIELPSTPAAGLRDRIVLASSGLHGDIRILLFNCADGPDLSSLQDPELAVIALPCIGMLPPSMVDFAIINNHADGVFLTGCRDNDCKYRHGIRWMQERILRRREPFLREIVPRERIDQYWAGASDIAGLTLRLSAFKRRLRAMPIDNPESGGAGGVAGVTDHA
jgi:quinol-cytochrome oxidoreductase complex cytochrome b subunit/coenzyme F420-reducing hydrogenase delta subunit